VLLFHLRIFRSISNAPLQILSGIQAGRAAAGVAVQASAYYANLVRRPALSSHSPGAINESSDHQTSDGVAGKRFCLARSI
jgi:hypothetical protein